MKKLFIIPIILSFLFTITSCNKNENKDYEYGAIVETFSFAEEKELLSNNSCNLSRENEIIEISYDFEKDNGLLTASINYTNKNLVSNEEHIITVDNYIHNFNYVDEDELILTNEGVYAPCVFQVSYENNKNEIIKEDINKYHYNYYPTFAFTTTNNAKNLNVYIKFTLKTDTLPCRLIATYYSSKSLLNEGNLKSLSYGIIDEPQYILGNIDETNKFNKKVDIFNGNINYNYSINKEDDYYLNNQEITLTVSEVLSDTTYNFKLCNFSTSDDIFYERVEYPDKDSENKLYYRNTVINYEYTLKGKVIKETIDKYYIDDQNAYYSITMKFPKNAKDIKLNISSSFKKNRKINSFLEGIHYRIN